MIQLFDCDSEDDFEMKDAKAAGMVGLIHRSGEGLWKDPSCLARASEARVLGMSFGLYHFVRPLDDAEKQAEAFAEAVKQVGGVQIVPFFDYEWAGEDSKEWERIIGISSRRQYILDLEGAFRRASGLAISGRYGGISWVNDEAGLEGFFPSAAQTVLWIADDRSADNPPLPVPYQSWVLWQTGEKKVAWAKNPMDLDQAPVMPPVISMG